MYLHLAFLSELISNLISQHFSQLVGVKAVGEWVQRLLLLVHLRLQHGDDVLGRGYAPTYDSSHVCLMLFLRKEHGSIAPQLNALLYELTIIQKLSK